MAHLVITIGCEYGAKGNQIGKKDHATVLYACKAVADLMETDRKFKMEVEEIQRKLYCGN